MMTISMRGAVLTGLTLLAAPACSTHHPGPYHGPGIDYRDTRGHDRAYERGYHHGVEAGVKDWRKDRRFDPWRHGKYRSGDSGYSSRYGPREYYCRAYRAGFRTGYELGYSPPRKGHRGRWSHRPRY